MKFRNIAFMAILVIIIFIVSTQFIKPNVVVKEGAGVSLPCDVYNSLKTIEDILNGTTKLNGLDQAVPCVAPGVMVPGSGDLQVKDVTFPPDKNNSYSYNEIIQNVFDSGKIFIKDGTSDAVKNALKKLKEPQSLVILASFVDKINSALENIYKTPINSAAVDYLSQILNNNVFYFLDNKKKYCTNFLQSLKYVEVILRALFGSGSINSESGEQFYCFFSLQKDKANNVLNGFLTNKITNINMKLKDITFNYTISDCTNSEPPFITNLAVWVNNSDKKSLQSVGDNITKDAPYSGGIIMTGVSYDNCPPVTTFKAATTKPAKK